jgi:hypothetical protein
MINAGMGVNFLGTAMSLRYGLNLFWMDHGYENIRIINSPMYNIGINYGLAKNLTAGVTFGYQNTKAVITVTDTAFNDVKYTDTWQRMYMGICGDYHFVAKENISLYTGLKFGYNHYTMSSTITAVMPNYIDKLDMTLSTYSLQAHFGLNYYFNSIVGFNTEIGFGYACPYVFNVGLAVKI